MIYCLKKAIFLPTNKERNCKLYDFKGVFKKTVKTIWPSKTTAECHLHTGSKLRYQVRIIYLLAVGDLSFGTTLSYGKLMKHKYTLTHQLFRSTFTFE